MAFLGEGVLLGKVHFGTDWSGWYAEQGMENFGDVWLYLLFFCIAIILMAYNASIAAVNGINVICVPEWQRSFATGMELFIRNLFGFSCGPLLPGLMSTTVYSLSESLNHTLDS